MLITLQMMVGDQRAFCLEARMPDSFVDKEAMASTRVNACFDLAEEQIKEAREFIGDMRIGCAPVIEHNFHVKKRGKKAGQRKEGK